MQRYRSFGSASGSRGPGRTWCACSPSVRRKWLVGVPTAAVAAAAVIFLGVLSLVAYTRTASHIVKGNESAVGIGDSVVKWICTGMLHPAVCQDTLSNAPGAALHSPEELTTYLIATVVAALNESSRAVRGMLGAIASSGYANSTTALEVCNEVSQNAE